MNRVLSYFQNKFENIDINSDNQVSTYSSVQEELNSVKYGVGIYNRSESAVLNLKGKDVVDFLQRISTNDVKDIQQYYYVPTLFTNEKGRLIDRTILISVDEEFFLIGSKQNDVVLNRWLDRYIITEDVHITNRTGEFLILDIIGPQAESYLTMICGKEVDDLDNNRLHRVQIGESDGFLLKKSKGYNETLYWLISYNELSDNIFDFLLNQRSVFDLSMIGEKAFDYYRVLNKVPKKPNEINDNFNPHEAGLLNDISFKKGCYIGQEVIARIDTYNKIQKNLCKVLINGLNGKQTLPADIYNKDQELVCILTTLVDSIENSHHEGLAFIRKEFTERNTELADLRIDKTDTLINLKIVG